MHAFHLALAILALASSAAAAKCKAKAGMTTWPGPTGFLNVFNSDGKKIGYDTSLLCFTGNRKKLRQGTRIAGNDTISVTNAHLPHNVDVHVTCDGQFLDTCALQFGDFRSHEVTAHRGYARGSCEIDFDC